MKVLKKGKTAKNKRFIKERRNNLGPLVEKSNDRNVTSLSCYYSGVLAVLVGSQHKKR
jgi:hypothetical protein